MQRGKTVIEVWSPGVTLPKRVEKVASELKIDLEFDNVEIFRSGRRHGVYCSPICGWHKDPWVANWSLLLVVRNDANSLVQGWGVPMVRNQPVGTAILLEIRKVHRLCCMQRYKKTDVWAALCWDLNWDKKPTRDFCDKFLRSVERN